MEVSKQTTKNNDKDTLRLPYSYILSTFVSLISN